MTSDQSSPAIWQNGDRLGEFGSLLQPGDVSPALDALLMTIHREPDNNSLPKVVYRLVPLLDPGQLQRFADYLIQRGSEREFGAYFILDQDPWELLVKLIPRLEPAAIERLLTVSTGALRGMGEIHELAITAWIALEAATGTRTTRERAQAHVDLLKRPLVDGDTRQRLLENLDRVVGESFNGQLWHFVEWASTSDEGRALDLDLSPDERGD